MIEAGGRVYLLHEIFQRTGRTPDEIMSKPPGVRAFCLASMRVQLEKEAQEFNQGSSEI